MAQMKQNITLIVCGPSSWTIWGFVEDFLVHWFITINLRDTHSYFAFIHHISNWGPLSLFVHPILSLLTWVQTLKMWHNFADMHNLSQQHSTSRSKLTHTKTHMHMPACDILLKVFCNLFCVFCVYSVIICSYRYLKLLHIPFRM